MKRFFLFALVATMFAACVTDETQDVAVELAPETLTVSFEDTDSRIQLDNGKTVWTKGDLASVFYRSNANQQWQYQGETGDRTGELKRVNAGNATEIMKRVVVVYPYSESYYINTDTHNVEASLPASQSYLKDSYGVGGNIMISQSEFNQFSLKSVCGWLKIQLTGNGEKVKSIKLKGNAGEQVAGLIYINSATAEATLAAEMGGADDNENTAGGNLVFDDTILTEVTLDCGEGVELGAEPTAFFIALPPQTFAQGLTIEIEDTNAFKMTKSTDKEVIISRNAIQPMAELGYERIIPETWKIRYTATAKVSPYKTDVFGANIVSNEWDETTGEGVITFDGEVTAIGADAFNGLSSQSISYKLIGITIPESVISIGTRAFYGCDKLEVFNGKFAEDNGRCLIINDTLISYAVGNKCEDYAITSTVTKIGYGAFYRGYNLRSITLHNNLTIIDDHAFQRCGNITSITIPDSVVSIGDYAFDYCSSLANIDLGNGVIYLGACAFYGCANIETITIPESVIHLGGDIFGSSSKLKTVYCYPSTPPSDNGYYSNFFYYILPDGFKIYVYNDSYNTYKTSWSMYANYIYNYGDRPQSAESYTTITYTTSDQKIVTPSNLTIISNEYNNGIGTMVVSGISTTLPLEAFQNCNTLTTVIIPDNIKSIGSDAFRNCYRLADVTLPKDLIAIGKSAFYDCKSLLSIVIPDNVTRIESSTFSGCSKLSNVTMTNVRNIGSSAFNNCNIKSIVLPASVESINSYAFFSNYGINVYCKAATPPSLASGNGEQEVFSSVGGIYVPEWAVEKYKSSSDWGGFANVINGYDFEKGEVVE